MPDPVDKIQEHFSRLARGKPFALLGMRPSTNQAELKEAYFAKLARHQPHEDPAGFRRLRQIYESLSVPGALEAAYLLAPVSLREAQERFCDPLEGDLDRAESHEREARAEATAGERFFEAWASLTWADAASRGPWTAPGLNGSGPTAVGRRNPDKI